MNTRFPDDAKSTQGQLIFRCLDLGIKVCDWQTSGDSETDLLLEIEIHLRDTHDFGFDEVTRIMVRHAIRRLAA
jgi:predicted small metal-binding protein